MRDFGNYTCIVSNEINGEEWKTIITVALFKESEIIQSYSGA